jgi:hypothetical protein
LLVDAEVAQRELRGYNTLLDCQGESCGESMAKLAPITILTEPIWQYAKTR